MASMKFLKVEKPRLTQEAIGQFLRESYGLAGELRALETERDQNYRLTEAGGQRWVVRITNRDEDATIVAAQVAALEHIGATDPELPCPRLRRALDGAAISSIRDQAGRKFQCHVLSYLPGEIVGERPLDRGALRAVGAMVARLGLALRGFFHPALGGRGLLWDSREAPQLIDFVRLLPEANERALALEILEDFRDRTLPKMAALRAQAIHGDVHPYNLLIDEEGGITGIIDFGDLIHAPLIQDLAHLIGDFLRPDQDPGETIAALVEGYRQIMELEEAEAEILLDLILIRLLQTPLINAIRAENMTLPENYLGQFGERCLPIVAAIRARDQDLRRLIRRSCALSTTPEARTRTSVAGLLKRRYRVMGEKPYLFYDPPLHLIRGEGVWLFDADGKRYLDCYNNVPHVGHCHPYVAEAIVRQVRLLNTNTRYVTNQSIEYAERLIATLDPSLSAVAFVNSGSEANDVAWRMAKAWTGAKGGLAMEFAYHGITEATDAFSPSGSVSGLVPGHIRTFPPPDDYRGPYKRGEPDLGARYAALADQPITELREAGNGLAAAMVDSAFMTNGMLEAPKGYVAEILKKVRKASGLFIADEVQSGFGRMGSTMWGHQHHGVIPDFVTIGKPAGNGHPLGAIITRPEILDRFMTETAFFSTFGGNNVACAAGLAVLDVIRDEQLIENAARTGAILKAGLKLLMEKHAIIGDVRGTGLALGLELVRDRKTLEPASAEAKRLLSLARDQGVLVGGEGKFANIVKIRPPIVFRPEHAEIAIAAIDRALGQL